VIEQEIRFCSAGGDRVAFAIVGSGPALLLPALWIGHLELEWGFDEFRAFVGALARNHTVIRHDRIGTGLSDRPARMPDLTVEGELRVMEAIVDALDLDELSLLGISWGGCSAVAYAARHPERVRSLALVGAYARGSEIAPASLREALLRTVRAHWGAGSRVLTDVWLPGVDAHTRERFARLQRAAASAELAAATLEAVYETDVRELLPRVRAPALVVHRRGDRAMPFAQGRELAAELPGARLIGLDGELHPPWLGDSAAVLDAISAFLDAHHRVHAPAAAAPVGGDEAGRAPAASADPDSGPLSDREREVLRLVAEGLSDAQIAQRLIVSPHTVHRHVANIRTKLGQPSRAAAAAYAARRGLI
jgi:pimeloyl-ACP methyl ester carboxylesterase/DNA-binding CsgD family transcriptional regulator